MTQVTKTSERTLNKAIKKQLVELMPTAKKLVKKHVAGVGYVSYVKDAQNNTLGKVFRDFQGMTIYVG